MLEPNWDIWERLDWFIAPFKVGSEPYSFRYQQIRHLQGLSADAVRLADAQSQLMADIEAASRPRAGKPAIFISGPFAGMTVHIAGIEGAEAILTLMGMPVRATVDSLKNLG